ncbi:glycerate kinase [Desulfuromonas carbonis]|uniref:glycerate kinase type-2 family protein n=1 Tax=Desulfuromonas sp. DDH964 TaxID=1823759 RepID=UPI00078D7512|nr:DUF4147 domain-containing protein [Desulfuromonas sp. DDH964]AMV71463.1 Putative hydroxypyruvate reductase [Desulfuromonas sp. DDH964]
MQHPVPGKELEEIFRAALASVDPQQLIASRLQLSGSRLTVTSESTPLTIDLDDYDQLMVFGAGKATAAMARGLEKLLGSRIGNGLIVVKYGHTAPLTRIETLEAGHPIPDQASLLGARRIAALALRADSRTLVINLISGGGSALLAAPRTDSGLALSLTDKQATTRLLLRCGATIDELNCVRKHLSALKGGGLARLLAPARSLNLILSDVIGDRLDVIASGLCVPDPTTFSDALAILDRYRLPDRVPGPVLDLLRAGAAGKIAETPKPGDPAFRWCDNLLLGNNKVALQAASREASSRGFTTTIVTDHACGEARELARRLLAAALDYRDRQRPGRGPACLLAGGETTVTLRGDGKGGRNQELALAFLAAMAELPDLGTGLYLLSAASDGNDGPTDAAGAFACSELLAAATVAGLDPADYLARNDAYSFFDRLGALLRTGPTNTNVCDLQLILIP